MGVSGPRAAEALGSIDARRATKFAISASNSAAERSPVLWVDGRSVMAVRPACAATLLVRAARTPALRGKFPDWRGPNVRRGGQVLLRAPPRKTPTRRKSAGWHHAGYRSPCIRPAHR